MADSDTRLYNSYVTSPPHCPHQNNKPHPTTTVSNASPLHSNATTPKPSTITSATSQRAHEHTQRPPQQPLPPQRPQLPPLTRTPPQLWQGLWQRPQRPQPFGNDYNHHNHHNMHDNYNHSHDQYATTYTTITTAGATSTATSSAPTLAPPGY